MIWYAHAEGTATVGKTSEDNWWVILISAMAVVALGIAAAWLSRSEIAPQTSNDKSLGSKGNSTND